MAWKGTAGIVRAALLAAALPAWGQPVGFLALADGKVFVVRGSASYVAPVGMRLREGDLLRTEGRAQAHVQLQDGTLLDLGADSQALLDRVAAAHGGTGASQLELLSGWAKMLVKPGKSTPSWHVLTPQGQLKVEDASFVLHTAPGGLEAFVESGSAALVPAHGRGPEAAPRALRAGQFIAVKPAQAPVVAQRPAPEFVKAMPRPFQDPLPVLPDKLKDRAVEPRLLHETPYEEVEDWLKSGLPARPALVRRFRGRARDPAFRAGLVKNLRAHPEWDRILFPEKYEERDKKDAAAARAHS